MPDDRLGRMSYVQDPSLRYHHYGPVEPMEMYSCSQARPAILKGITFIGLMVGVLLWIIL